MCLFTKPTHSIYHTTLLLPGSSGGAAPPRAVSSLTVPTLLMHGPILSHKLPVQDQASTSCCQALVCSWTLLG